MDLELKKAAEVDVLVMLLEFLKAKSEAGKTIDDVIESVERAIKRKTAA